jgi:hypothetical protein
MSYTAIVCFWEIDIKVVTKGLISAELVEDFRNQLRKNKQRRE